MVQNKDALLFFNYNVALPVTKSNLKKKLICIFIFSEEKLLTILTLWIVTGGEKKTQKCIYMELLCIAINLRALGTCHLLKVKSKFQEKKRAKHKSTVILTWLKRSQQETGAGKRINTVTTWTKKE